MHLKVYMTFAGVCSRGAYELQPSIFTMFRKLCMRFRLLRVSKLDKWGYLTYTAMSPCIIYRPLLLLTPLTYGAYLSLRVTHNDPVLAVVGGNIHLLNGHNWNIHRVNPQPLTANDGASEVNNQNKHPVVPAATRWLYTFRWRWRIDDVPTVRTYREVPWLPLGQIHPPNIVCSIRGHCWQPTSGHYSAIDVTGGNCEWRNDVVRTVDIKTKLKMKVMLGIMWWQRVINVMLIVNVLYLNKDQAKVWQRKQL